MRDFPQELFFLLVFGVGWLVQWVYERWRRRALAQQAQAEAATEDQATPEPESAHPTSRPGRTATAPQPQAAPPAAPRAATLRASAPTAATTATASSSGRFNRRDLLADRRALRDAIVMAAILQPCHAIRPHDPG